MKRLTYLVASAVACVCFTATQVRADPSASDLVQWEYSWTHPFADGSIHSDVPGTGGVSLTKELTRNAVGSSDVVATNLRTFSTADATSPDKLNVNGAYSLTITVTDTASGASGELTFTGKLSGSFTQNGANVTNQFTGDLTQSITLGDNTYTVTIFSYTPPGPSSAESSGSIGAHVEVSAGATIQKVPEPSTLLLSFVGLGLCGGARWRNRRKVAVTA